MDHEAVLKAIREEAEKKASMLSSLESVYEQLGCILSELRGCRPKSRRKAGITKAEVEEVVKQLDVENMALSKDQVKEKVTEAFKAEGRNLSGLPLRLKQVLAKLSPAEEAEL